MIHSHTLHRSIINMANSIHLKGPQTIRTDPVFMTTLANSNINPMNTPSLNYSNSAKLQPKQERKSHPRCSFTYEEDCLLVDLVTHFGTDSWITVASFMGGRNPRQCKDRYMCYLSPTIRNDPFTKEEDDLLREKYREIGPKWVKISKFFGNRTDISIKCRWAVLNRRDQKKATRIRKAKKPPVTTSYFIPFNSMLNQTSMSSPIIQNNTNVQKFDIIKNQQNIKPFIEKCDNQISINPKETVENSLENSGVYFDWESCWDIALNELKNEIDVD
ncbi:Myb-like DNA-binding domain containing protein [Tritrichomonas foetus]|uniref:Myb-like DNA-binding domain containing protein n=1 Tax=Tritrichomonas foetus TaxID=1144522 RepID=A0A1J4K335_9EUKA|nr:Myb-like DNA-binding domain containing protein [Tritrichomonas foetus]|eukprot:OHT04134.1 Myb-like DNA-binding domain containing protein [Tritrichomonas foetus]